MIPRLLYTSLLAMLLLASCKLRHEGAQAKLENVGSAAAAPTKKSYQYSDPLPMLPTSGRSTFDLLVAKWTPQGQEPVIPYPIGELARKLQEETNEALIDAILIPRGRSLQKDAAKPNYLANPRVVLGATQSDLASIEDTYTPVTKWTSLPLQGRIYVGYVKSANQLEVISYNEEMGRFEFQVVKNYLKGGKPKIYYADRGLCGGCHQGFGPIFPQAPWTETSVNDLVFNKIKAATDANSEKKSKYGVIEYEGLRVTHRNFVASSQPFNNEAQDFNSMTFQSSRDLAPMNAYWREGCGGSAKGSAYCRAALLRSSLFKSQTCDDPSFRAPKEYYALTDADEPLLNKIPDRIHKIYGGPLQFIDPFEEPINSFDESKDILEQITNLNFERGSLHNPLTKRSVKSAEFHGLCKAMPQADGVMLTRLFDNDAKALATVIDSLAKKTEAGTSDVFADKNFSRHAIYNALFKEAGRTAPKICCDQGDMPGWEAEMEPIAVAQASKEGEALASPLIAHLKTYCYQCHATADKAQPFLEGANEQIEKRLHEGTLAQNIYDRLFWKTESDPSNMPLKGSASYQQLVKPENSAVRNEMLVLLEPYLK